VTATIGGMSTLVARREQTRTGPSEALQIIRALWTHCGPKYALLWLLQGTVLRWLKLRVMHICVHETQVLNAAVGQPLQGYEIRVATEDEMARGVPDDPTFPSWPALQESLAQGDWMIAAFYGGRIVSYGWCSARPAAIAADLTIGFGRDILYGDRAYTVHQHRGRGLHAAIIMYSRQEAMRRGKTVVAYIDANNYRSLISESRVAPMHSGVAAVSRRAGRLRYWASPLCRKVGLALRWAPSIQ
jgi:hypothetical protein